MGVVGRFVAVAVSAALGLSAGTLALAPAARSLVDAGEASDTEIDLDPLAQRSIVYARDGSVLAVLHAEENRSTVPLADVPPHVIRVILAVEDEHFFEHGGVNLRSTARALLSNVEAGTVVQGGSTITQQVVKNSLLTPERTIDRKVQEAALAVRLERDYSKEQILERYLNIVYFGNGAYGLQAAAETYFAADAADLTLGQAALLAAVIRNPVGYDPIRFPETARSRRALVMRRLVDIGYVDEAAAAAVDAEALPTVRNQVLPRPDDHFVEAVKQELLDDERLGESPQERFNAVFRGGLRIHTTLDPSDQEAAEEAVASRLPDTKGRFTAALVSVEPGVGAVRALVGGPGFEQSKYNLATQARRQPGSSFKPIVLAAALAAGHSTRDTINGVGPCRFDLPGVPEPWRPQNYGNSRGGVYSLEKSLQLSLNCAYARLGLLVGPDEVVEMARQLGIESPLDPVAAISLGSEEVTPLELAGAYAAFANDGEWVEPHLVERVEDRAGRVLLSADPDRRQVLEPNLARMAVAAMERVVTSGTGTSARLRGRDAAGKTGTAQDYANAWFVGFTPQRAAAVWMGAIGGNVPMTSVGGVRVTGGTYPAAIWRTYLTAALQGQPSIDFTAPSWKGVKRAQYLRLPGERPYRRRTPTTVAAEPSPTPSPEATVPPATAPPATAPPATAAPVTAAPAAGQ